MNYIAGVVPEPARQVAQDGEDVESFELQHNGRVRPVRRHGQTLAAAAALHRSTRRLIRIPATSISSRRRHRRRRWLPSRRAVHAVAAQ